MSKLKLFDAKKEYTTSILVVEDDEDDFEIVISSFRKSQLENPIVWLQSGEFLIDYLLCQNQFEKDGHPNPLLIFLDINMPKINAEETLEKLKSHHIDLANLRIVLLTNAEKEWVQTTSMKNFPYMQKPLTFEKLYDYVINNSLYLFD